jgi:dolichol-phosphate mannosyltransferase
VVVVVASAPRCVVVVPTFNERENIALFLEALRNAVPSADVLVVDDNSPDGTGPAAEQAASELGQIKVLHRPGKQGLGSAYRHGFQVALDESYDVVVTMDVDFSHDPAVVPTMIATLAAGADAVIGSRYVEGGGTENWPVHRRLLSRWGNRYTAFVLGMRVRDCTSGFRAYRVEALRAIEPRSTGAEGYAFLTELVRRLVRRGYSVVEVPIVFRDRELGTSKMSGRIIAESMLLVTRWGMADVVRRWRSRLRTGRST